MNLAIEELQNECQLYISDKATLCIYDGDNYIYTELDKKYKDEYNRILRKELAWAENRRIAYINAKRAYKEKFGYQVQ